MNKITEKFRVGNSRKKTSVDSSCFSVCKMMQKETFVLKLFKIKVEQKNHQGTENYSTKSGFGEFSILRKNGSHGACATVDDTPNCSRSLTVTPFAMIFCMI